MLSSGCCNEYTLMRVYIKANISNRLAVSKRGFIKIQLTYACNIGFQVSMVTYHETDNFSMMNIIHICAPYIPQLYMDIIKSRMHSMSICIEILSQISLNENSYLFPCHKYDEPPSCSSSMY